MWDDWVIDLTISEEDGLYCFVPVEWHGDDPLFVIGMNLLTSIDGFEQGKIIGVIHEAGQEAVDEWCREHPGLLEALRVKQGIVAASQPQEERA